MSSGLPTLPHPTGTPSRLAAVAYCPFVSFTVTGIVRNSHPRSLGGRNPRRIPAQKHTLFNYSISILHPGSSVKHFSRSHRPKRNRRAAQTSDSPGLRFFMYRQFHRIPHNRTAPILWHPSKRERGAADLRTGQVLFQMLRNTAAAQVRIRHQQN